MTYLKVLIFSLYLCKLCILKLSIFQGSAITKLIAKLISPELLKPIELIKLDPQQIGSLK